MKHKPAFLLVEWMIQCVVLTLLVVITASVTVAWYKNISRAHQLFSYTLPLYIAADVMRVDVHNAHRLSFEHDKLTLVYPHQVYAWYATKNQLVRSSTTYDIKEHHWKRPTVAMIASRVISTAWTSIIRQEGLVGVSVLLCNKHSCVEATCVARNGLII